MKTLFYLHWDEKELKDRIKPLKKLGLKIHSHWSQQDIVKWGDTLPEIFVISLDKLPSHGRQYAQWIWEAKKNNTSQLYLLAVNQIKLNRQKQNFLKQFIAQTTNL